MRMIIQGRKIWFTISGVLVLCSIIVLLVNGLNLGIDFTGGVLMELMFDREVTVAEVRDVLAQFGLEHSQITTDQHTLGSVLIRTEPMSEGLRADILAELSSSIAPVRSDDIHLVSPVIATELIRLAVTALAIAIVAMIIYISLRFEFKFALVAIVALFHDALLVVGLFSLLQINVSSAFIPAILTIMGYSVNDTIVVFDRIRENQKILRKQPITKMVAVSINQTLRRSLLTSVTTILAVSAIYILGGNTLQPFALALGAGILCGTYSSIFLASPLWMVWKATEPRMKKRLQHS